MPLHTSRNLLLRQLPPDERQHLERHFVDEPLAFKQTLHAQGGPIQSVYFVETGVVSLLTDFASGEVIETGTVGNEGVVGLAAILGVSRSPGRALCQVPGRALALPTRFIDEARRTGSEWFTVLLRYTNFVAAMAAQSAACNRMHTVDARMSRWLLMTHDRVDGDQFPLTQEFLSQMLGVARPTVNTAGSLLQRAGFITYTRGTITIRDRAGLEQASCECYVRIRELLAQSTNGQAPASTTRGRRHPAVPRRSTPAAGPPKRRR